MSYRVYSFNNYPYYKLKEIEPLKVRKQKGKKRFLNDFFTFDIETTNIDDIKQGIMYIWQIYIQGSYIVGRTVKQLQYTINKINNYIENNIVCYVHNLSFEFAYIRELFKWDKVLITRAHTILICEYEKIIFRCSYLLTNMSLSKFTEKMEIENKKLSGEFFNYNKKRFYNTKLNKYELQYCLNDVSGLYQALKKFIELEGENLQSIPLTSTGFIRRELKEKLIDEVGINYGYKRKLNEKQYNLLKRAFRGGNTHANRFYTTTVKEELNIKNVYSFDKKSSYPEQMCIHKYPVNKFSGIYDYTQKEAEKLINDDKKCFVFYLKVSGIQLIDIYEPCPYLPTSKCLNKEGALDDNGRILKAEMLLIAITDIDYKIIKKQYKFKIEYIKGMCCKAGFLPTSYIELIKEYFHKKENIDKEKDGYYYMRTKEKINSIYGVCVTDILRDNIIYKNKEFILQPIEDKEYELESKAKYNPLLYQVGVYVSAWARYELQELIDIVGYDFRYCDTDSVKFVNGEKYIDKINKINGRYKKECVERGVVIENKKGEKIYLGVWENEGIYKKFRTLGAKKYVYTDEQENLHITIAGVPKESVKELEKIENFKEGFIFKHGGIEGRYNDYYGKYKYKGLEIEINENLYLHNHEYTLGVGKDYKAILESILRGEFESYFNEVRDENKLI